MTHSTRLLRPATLSGLEFITALVDDGIDSNSFQEAKISTGPQYHDTLKWYDTVSRGPVYRLNAPCAQQNILAYALLAIAK